MMATEGWTCVTCRTRVCTPHCSECGESEIRTSELGLRHLLIEAFHSLTNVDGRLLRSFRALLFHPGDLTIAYLEGPRKPYISPFEVFLIANVLFFAIQAITPDKVFSTPLASHLHGQDWSALARHMVANRVAEKHVTVDAYAPVFDHAVAVNARALVFAMGVPFALLLMLLFVRGTRQFAAHVVFTLHFYAFQLLILCPLLALLLVETWFGGSGVASGAMDVALFAIQLGISAVYLYVATGKVYGVRGARRLLSVAGLIAAVGGVVLGYRFFIFVVTLYGT
jgi:hypothetical protein